MYALFISCLVCASQIVAGFLLPGMFLHWCLSKSTSHPDVRGIQTTEHLRFTRSQYLFQCLGLGSIYLTLQFLLQFLLCRLGSSPTFVLGATLSMHLVFSGLWLRDYRRCLGERCVWLSPIRWQPSSHVQLVIGIGFGVSGVLFLPHGLDNSAIGWVTISLDQLQKLQDTQGAISYIGLLFMPSLLLEGIAPVPTIAASLKILMSILLAATCKRLVEAFANVTPIAGARQGWLALILQLTVLTTFFGKYGVFETGKETAFAVLFLFVFAAELIARSNDENESWWLTASPLAAAIGFGAMTVPYAFTFTVTFLFFSIGTINLFRFCFCSIAASSLALIVSFHAMTDWSWNRSIFIIIAPLFIFGVADLLSRRNRFRPMPVIPGGLAYLILFASLTSIVILMPVSFHRDFFPLDGKSGLIKVISHQNKFVVPGVFGIVLFILSRKNQKNAGSLAFLLFPFLALIPALVMAHWYSELRVPLHAQNVWDWAKDIPNWILGIYFGVFGVLALNFVLDFVALKTTANPTTRTAKTANAIPLHAPRHWAFAVIGLFLVFMNINLIAKNTTANGIPTYTAIGGHYDRKLAEFVEWAYLFKATRWHDRFAGKPILIAEDSDLNRHIHTLHLYGVNTISESKTAAKGQPLRNKYWCVGPVERMDVLMESLGFADRFVAIEECRLLNEAVFRLEKVRHARKAMSVSNELK